MVESEHLKSVYFDVLLCSIHGDRSLLSLLSGGEYLTVKKSYPFVDLVWLFR